MLKLKIQPNKWNEPLISHIMRIYSGESARVLPHHGQLCRRRGGARAPPSAFPRYGRGAEATPDASPRVPSARRDHRVDAEDERTQTVEEVSVGERQLERVGAADGDERAPLRDR